MRITDYSIIKSVELLSHERIRLQLFLESESAYRQMKRVRSSRKDTLFLQYPFFRFFVTSLLF